VAEAAAFPIAQIEAFQPLPILMKAPAGQTHPIGNSAGAWSFVRPCWMVTTINTGPYYGALHDPPDWPMATATSAVAIDVKTGGPKRLRLTTPDFLIHSLLPMGEDLCGIVVRKKDSQAGSDLQIFSWCLKTGHIGKLRPWADINLIARHLNLAKCEVHWPATRKLDPDSSLITIGGNPFPSTSSVPLPFHDYATPLEMTSLWEEEKETRWYAPTDDGTGIILFRGVREGKWDIGVPYSQKSSLTLYSPKARGGIRWQRTLSGICNDRWMQGLLPIYSHWQGSDDLLLQCAYTGIRSEPTTVCLTKLRLQDGTVRGTATLTTDAGFDFCLKWPNCTADQKRIAYMVEHPKYTPKIAVYDFENARFLDEISCPSKMADNLFTELTTVLTTNEAVIDDGLQLWAIGIGPKNYGKSRVIARLFIEVDRDEEELWNMPEDWQVEDSGSGDDCPD